MKCIVYIYMLYEETAEISAKIFTYSDSEGEIFVIVNR